jgi:hypothetical protein
MTQQRANVTLTELRCDAESESGGCEPYLYTSFFALGGNQPQVVTPEHADVRNAFANDVMAGQSLPIPQEIGSASFSLDGGQHTVGVAALVIDEDLSREVAVDKGRDAFARELESQLQAGETDVNRIREAVLSKVRGAINASYDYTDLHQDQDDQLGFGIQLLGPEPREFEVELGALDDRFTLKGRVSVDD